MRLGTRLLRTFVPRWNQVTEPAVRTRYGFLENWVSIPGNTLMGVGKLALGLWVNSIAPPVDAGHTFSDSLTSAVVLTGLRTAQRRSDPHHPRGHGRMEPVATLLVAVRLECPVESARRRFLTQEAAANRVAAPTRDRAAPRAPLGGQGA